MLDKSVVPPDVYFGAMEGRQVVRCAKTPEERESCKEMVRRARAAMRDLTLREAELVEDRIFHEHLHRYLNVPRPGKVYVVLRCTDDGRII